VLFNVYVRKPLQNHAEALSSAAYTVVRKTYRFIFDYSSLIFSGFGHVLHRRKRERIILYSLPIPRLDDVITTSHCNFTSSSYIVHNNNYNEIKYVRHLSSKDKMLIKTYGNLKDFFARRLISEFLGRMGG